MVNETIILNTSLYTFKFTDGVEDEHSSIIIAENIGSMSQDEGVIQGHV